MTDLSQQPPVPPEDMGGDERYGLAIAGALLLFFGLGLCIVANVLLHLWAGTSGLTVGPWHVGSTYGAYGWGAIALGILTASFGAVLVYLSTQTHGGPFVLPGSTY